MKKIRIFIIVFIVTTLVILFFKYFVAIERIEAGYVGIKVNLVGNNRGIDDITEVTGWVLYMPLFTQIHEFPTFTQVKDYEPFHVNAKDGSEFTVDPTFSYYVNKDMVPRMFSQYRRSLDELEDGYIRNVIMDCYRIIANQFSSDSLIYCAYSHLLCWLYDTLYDG